MGEKGALPLVQSRDSGHVLPRQGEVKYLQIFPHPLDVGGLGDDGDAPLDMPTQHHLRRRLSVFCADLGECRVREQAAPPFSEGGPGFHLDAVFVQPLFCFGLLVERMDLNLIHQGTDAGERGDVHHPVGIEVGDADGAKLSGLIQVLQRPVGAVIIGKGLVEQHQIQIIRPQLLHGFQHGCFCLLISVMLDPDLGRQEDLLPGNA